MDGIHFAKEGAEFFEKRLWPHIYKITKDLPAILPDWKDVDNDNPSDALAG